MSERKRLELPPEIMDEIKKHDRYPAHARELIEARLKEYYQERLVEAKRAIRKPVGIGANIGLFGREVVITGFTFMEKTSANDHGELLEPVVEVDRVCFSFLSDKGIVNHKIPVKLLEAARYNVVDSKALTIEEYHEDLANFYGWKKD